MADNEILASALRKVAWRLPPFMGLLCLLSLSTANVSFASLQMNKDLGFTRRSTPGRVASSSSLWLSMPSNMILDRIGQGVDRRVLAGPIAIAWPGSTAPLVLLLASCSDPKRGCCGPVLYLTYWFPRPARI